MSNQPNGLDVKIARCEERINSVEKKLDKFTTNDFWHFQKSVETKFTWLFGLFVTLILAVVGLTLQ